MDQSDVRYSELKEKLSVTDDGSSWNVHSESNNNTDAIPPRPPAPKFQKNNRVIVRTVNEYELTNDTADRIGVIKPEEQDHLNYVQPAPIKWTLKTVRSIALVLMCIVILNIVVGIGMMRHYLKIKTGKIVEFKDPKEFAFYSNISQYCLTDECMLASSSIYNSINQNADPCDNFYEYACGSWLQNTLIPTGFPRWGTLTSITYRNQIIIRNRLESPLTNVTEAEMKAKRLFKSCIDPTGRIEELGSKPLMNILGQFMYKNDKNQIEMNGSLTDILTHIQINYGLNALFDLAIQDDEKNSTFNNIEITQGSLGLESFYMNQTNEKNKEAMKIYKDTIVNVINLLFGPVDNSTKITEDMIELETRIAQIMYDTEDIADVEMVYKRATLKELSTEYASFINWKEFLNKILRTYGSPEVMKDEDMIIVMGLEYFEKLTVIINEYKATPEKEKTLKIFTIFYLIRFSLPLLSSEYRDQFNELVMVLTGSEKFERWQACVEQTDNIMGMGYAVSRLFIRDQPNNSKTAAKQLIKSIKTSFVKNFVNIPWMNAKTRRLAESKVNNVDDLIGYPDFIENDKLLNALYKDVEIKEDTYFENEVNLIQYALKKQILTYRKPVNRKEWEMTPSAVNAYYSPTRNQIVFPNGILQKPFFHPKYPMYLNYGSMGSVMGHELAHGFDNSGREYDEKGMLNQWWDQKTIDDFNTASACIVSQYSKFNVSNEPVNGQLTLGENIADNGGMRASFNAYKQWARVHGEEKPLPLLNMNPGQLFFISFAQTWCTKTTQNTAHMSISNDQHSPPRFRVIGTLSNSEEFSQAFKCPLGSKMNPVKKCKLW